jgi:hypothetical protein
VNTHIYHCSRKDEGTEQIDEDEEPHRETAEAEQLWQDDKFAQIVYRRVDPSSTLGEQDLPAFRCHGMCDSIRTELGLETGEVLHQQRRQESIFTETEQILLVEGVHIRLGVLFDDTVGDDDWATFVGCADAVEGEATGKTCDGAKKRFEGLRKMVGNVIFVDLDHGPPRDFFVG